MRKENGERDSECGKQGAGGGGRLGARKEEEAKLRKVKQNKKASGPDWGKRGRGGGNKLNQ